MYYFINFNFCNIHINIYKRCYPINKYFIGKLIFFGGNSIWVLTGK